MVLTSACSLAGLSLDSRCGPGTKTLNMVDGMAIRERLVAVHQRICELSHGRSVRLLLISKTQPKESIYEAYTEGHREFGENYVQELTTKAPELPDDIQWTFVGHLQSNKCNILLQVPNLKRISTVDRVELATKLEQHCQRLNRNIEVMVQVNATGEISKYGVQIEDVQQLVDYILTECPRLLFRGFMTIGPTHGDPQEVRRCFQVMASLRNTILSQKGPFPHGLELSMGMSSDMDEALLFGTDEVRIGTVIFGKRSYPASSLQFAPS